ncbi:hypothetical protein [Helcococcus sueciensis]|uniref:hypothetical protein n=1 Tax=Helcococcus sueciensis TaxID=241555 RepID=UPI0004011DD0|nr:hypothetical protein [Helcococcus sueciensis]
MEVRFDKKYKYSPNVVIEDEEANKKVVYKEMFDINAYIYPAGGQVQVEQWGKELPYIFNLLTNEDKLKEGYGIAFNSDEVNYKVVSIKPYTNHFLCEIKKI